MTKVLVAGTFDLLHPGHIYFLNQAKKYGRRLIIVVARDKTVLKVKKCLPVNGENVRLANLKKLKIADRVILGNRGDKLRVIEENRPDTICLGYDQKAFTRGLRNGLKNRKLKIKIN